MLSSGGAPTSVHRQVFNSNYTSPVDISYCQLTVALEVAPRERSLARVPSSHTRGRYSIVRVSSSHTRVRYSIARVSSSYARVLYSIARVPSSDTRVPHSILHCECPQLLPRTCGGCGARYFVPRPTIQGRAQRTL